jgi:hypothetical protein
VNVKLGDAARGGVTRPLDLAPVSLQELVEDLGPTVSQGFHAHEGYPVAAASGDRVAW